MSGAAGRRRMPPDSRHTTPSPRSARGSWPIRRPCSTRGGRRTGVGLRDSRGPSAGRRNNGRWLALPGRSGSSLRLPPSPRCRSPRSGFVPVPDQGPARHRPHSAERCRDRTAGGRGSPAAGSGTSVVRPPIPRATRQWPRDRPRARAPGGPRRGRTAPRGCSGTSLRTAGAPTSATAAARSAKTCECPGQRTARASRPAVPAAISAAWRAGSSPRRSVMRSGNPAGCAAVDHGRK